MVRIIHLNNLYFNVQVYLICLFHWFVNFVKRRCVAMSWVAFGSAYCSPSLRQWSYLSYLELAIVLIFWRYDGPSMRTSPWLLKIRLNLNESRQPLFWGELVEIVMLILESHIVIRLCCYWLYYNCYIQGVVLYTFSFYVSKTKIIYVTRFVSV